MYLWKTPEKLRRLSIMILCMIPLAIIAQLIARRAPWWKWDPVNEWPKVAFVAGFTIFSAFFISRTKRWAFFTSAAGIIVFFLFCLGYSIRQENVALGLYSIALGIISFGFIDRLWAAYHQPAIFPGMSWYQSQPESIPGLSADWGENRGLRLSRLDLDSGFIIGKLPKVSKKELPTEITLHYRGSKISCQVEGIAALASKFDSSWAGIGVEFKNKDRDAKKDLADFIEVLRGEGHVVT